MLSSSGSLKYADKLFDLKVDAFKKETSLRFEGRNMADEHFLSSGIRATPEGACEFLDQHGSRLDNHSKCQPLSILLIDDGKNDIPPSNLIFAINNEYGDKFSRVYGYFCRPIDGVEKSTQSASDDFRGRRQNRMTILNK